MDSLLQSYPWASQHLHGTHVVHGVHGVYGVHGLTSCTRRSPPSSRRRAGFKLSLLRSTPAKEEMQNNKSKDQGKHLRRCRRALNKRACKGSLSKFSVSVPLLLLQLCVTSLHCDVCSLLLSYVCRSLHCTALHAGKQPTTGTTSRKAANFDCHLTHLPN